MPKTTIYIRVDNWKYWQSINDKSDLVNKHLKNDQAILTAHEELSEAPLSKDFSFRVDHETFD